MASINRQEYIRKMKYLMVTKEDIKRAIIASGVDVTETDTFREYANKILEIQAGSEIPSWVELVSELVAIAQAAKEETEHYAMSAREALEYIETIKEQIELIETRIDDKVSGFQKQIDDLIASIGKPGGIAPLNEEGKIPDIYLPVGYEMYVIGYYFKGDFYKDDTHTMKIWFEHDVRDKKLYLDLHTNRLYCCINTGVGPIDYKYVRTSSDGDGRIYAGFYFEGKFYSDPAFYEEVLGEINKIYIDVNTANTYKFDGNQYLELASGYYALKGHHHVFDDIDDMGLMSKQDMDDILNL